MQRLEQYKSIFKGDFDFSQSTKILTLIPSPTVSGKKVYYIWSQRHSALSIPGEDVDTVLLWARGEAKEMIASKRANEIRSVSGYGESVTYGATSESIMKEAVDLKTKFEGKFSGSFITVG